MEGEELKSEFNISLISSLIKVTVLNKPLKNKLIHIKIGTKENIPTKEDFEALCVEMTKIVNYDPVNYSNTQFIVTGQDIEIKSYSLEKLKKRLTLFIIKSNDAYEALKDQIVSQLTMLKIPSEKFFVTKVPIRVERPENEAK